MPRVNPSDTDVLILCGGQGVRFRSVRNDIPKCLAPIRGRAFLDRLLDNLIDQGFRRFILATGYLGNQIEGHLQNRQDAVYAFSREAKPLGTGGAIKLAESIVKSNPFLILNGDSFIDYPLQALLDYHQEYGADVSILLSSVTEGLDYGNVEVGLDHRVISFSEKTSETTTRLTNAGVYCLNNEVLETLERSQSNSLERDCLPNWVSDFVVVGLNTDKVIYDIGTVDRYLAAQKAQFAFHQPDLKEQV